VRAPIVALLAGWLAGCSALPPIAIPEGEATIYVIGRGWHTDIGLPVDAAIGPLASLERDYPGVRFLVFGFGERGYFMGHEAGSGAMLAALLPSQGAILLTALAASPVEAFAAHRVVTLHLPRASVERIAARLWQDLEIAADGSPVRLADGPYVGSVFYAGQATYDAFNTCNTWTARLLRDGGVPVDPRGVLFASQVMEQVAWIASVQARAR